MIVCEYYFKNASANGSDQLTAWTAEVDLLAARGWVVIDCCRERLHPGHWTVVLGWPAEQFRVLYFHDLSRSDELPED